jgi:integrase
LTEALHRKQKGEPIATKRETVGQFLDRWLEDCVKLTVRPRSFASYAEQVRLHIKPAICNIQLSKLTAPDVQRFINSLANKDSRGAKKSETKKLSPRVVAYNRTILHMALKRAVKWRLIGFNPAADVEVPKWSSARLRLFLQSKRRHCCRPFKETD